MTKRSRSESMGQIGSDIGPAKQEMIEGTSKKVGPKGDAENDGSIGGVKVAALASNLGATEKGERG